MKRIEINIYKNNFASICYLLELYGDSLSLVHIYMCVCVCVCVCVYMYMYVYIYTQIVMACSISMNPKPVFFATSLRILYNVQYISELKYRLF
jgi:hypothetical protein